MRSNEIEILPFNPKSQKWEEIIKSVEVFPFTINSVSYNIPPKIYKKSFVLEQKHLFYRSDEHKVILTQEKNEYPLILTESKETVYDYDHDQFLVYIKFAKMGKGYVRVSLYEVGKANPIRIDKFKPRVMSNPHLTFGYNFSLKAGNYFLLFDNIKVDMDEFNKYESSIEVDNDIIFKWRGSDSFSPSYYISNGMLVLPFRIYQ